MPDIDIDFNDERRDEVIDYVVRQYGAERVAQIITFGTMAARAAVRDVGRVMGLPYDEVDRVAKLIPGQLRASRSTRRWRKAPSWPSCRTDSRRWRELIDMARKVEGLPRHASTHAAGRGHFAESR